MSQSVNSSQESQSLERRAGVVACYYERKPFKEVTPIHHTSNIPREAEEHTPNPSELENSDSIRVFMDAKASPLTSDREALKEVGFVF